MTSIRTHIRSVVLLGLALALLLGACGEDQPPPPAEGGPTTGELRLGLTEWSIETGGVSLLPGEIPVRVMNTGGTTHDVVVYGQEGTWASPVLDPGESYEMVITAVPGEELYLVCTLTGHESHGMHTRITVADSA